MILPTEQVINRYVNTLLRQCKDVIDWAHDNQLFKNYFRRYHVVMEEPYFSFDMTLYCLSQIRLNDGNYGPSDVIYVSKLRDSIFKVLLKYFIPLEEGEVEEQEPDLDNENFSFFQEEINYARVKKCSMTAYKHIRYIYNLYFFEVIDYFIHFLDGVFFCYGAKERFEKDAEKHYNKVMYKRSYPWEDVPGLLKGLRNYDDLVAQGIINLMCLSEINHSDGVVAEAVADVAPELSNE